MQGQGGGAKLKLPLRARAELQQDLKAKDFWSLPEIVSLLKDRYGVSYSPGHIRRLLKSWGMHHYKPQPRDYRRAKDAKEKLSERLQAVCDVMNIWDCSSKDIAFGFADESSPQANSNQARLWSFERKTRAVNTAKALRHNTFGFYALQGSSIVEELKDSKAASFLACKASGRQTLTQNIV